MTLSVPHVLLLQQGPRTSDAGEIFLNDLCQAYPVERLSRFALTEEPINSLPKQWQGNAAVYAHLPQECGILGFGSHVAMLTSVPLHFYGRFTKIPRLVSDAVHFGRYRRVDLVWAALSSPTLIYLANRVASHLGVPLVATIWDPPEHLSQCLRLDSFSRSSVLRGFDHTVRSAARCSVISEEMRSCYELTYGIDAIVLRHGIRSALRRPPRKELSDSRNLVIGFCGSLYAREEMRALISALSFMKWELDARRVTLRIVSSDVYLPLLDLCDDQEKQHIEWRRWCSQTEAIDLMAQADITYLPYWFDERYATSVQLCFPTKLTAYLAAGRPVLYHGPENSSVVTFFTRFPAGLGCHSLEPSDIAISIIQFVRNRDFYCSAVEAGQKALDEELNAQVFLARFASLIGVEVGALLTDSSFASV